MCQRAPWLKKRCGLHVHVREDGCVMGVARVKRVGVVPEPRRAVFQRVVGAARLVSVQETPLVTTPGEPTPYAGAWLLPLGPCSRDP